MRPVTCLKALTVASLCGSTLPRVSVARIVLDQNEVVPDRTEQIMAKMIATRSIDIMESVLLAAGARDGKRGTAGEGVCTAESGGEKGCEVTDGGIGGSGEAMPVYAMTDAYGVLHVCSVKEGKSNGKKALDGNASAITVMRGLDKCAIYHKDYWNYHWCHRSSISQVSAAQQCGWF
ncbi:unnamed protein product [Discosporangium mesarthrocarpum]